MFGEIAGPLEVADDAQGRDEGPKIRGDRLLASEEIEGSLFDVEAERVDDLVVGDDLVGKRDVGVDEGLGRPTDGTADDSGHLDEGVREALEVIVVGVAHGTPAHSPASAVEGFVRPRSWPDGSDVPSMGPTDRTAQRSPTYVSASSA